MAKAAIADCGESQVRSMIELGKRLGIDRFCNAAPWRWFGSVRIGLSMQEVALAAITGDLLQNAFAESWLPRIRIATDGDWLSIAEKQP